MDDLRNPKVVASYAEALRPAADEVGRLAAPAQYLALAYLDMEDPWEDQQPHLHLNEVTENFEKNLGDNDD
jgi:hypothetical protein